MILLTVTLIALDVLLFMAATDILRVLEEIRDRLPPREERRP